MPAYDPNNIFAKILRGELPCYKVYEDDSTLAFLDIMPRAPGHTLVLPKAPARNILDVSPDDLGHGIADLIQAPCIDANIVPDLVNLNAGAVHLPFEGGLAGKLP